MRLDRMLRLPFALGLAIASLTMAAMKMWPFTPPDQPAREAAAQAGQAPDALLSWLRDGLYPPLEKPEPGDWLAGSNEPSQSFEKYIGSRPNLPDGTRKVLYLMPLGEFGGNPRAPPLEPMREYLSLFFGMEARLMPGEPESAPAPASRINASTGKRQILTKDILKWLPGRLPPDAYAMLAVTMTDLYPQASWNFVFGEATFKKRVGVFSLARNDPAFPHGTGRLDPHPHVRALMLRRACVTLSHETGHMFGWAHCRFYRCLMGGSGSLEESDRTPAVLCPVCLHKLHAVRPFDPVRRQEALEDFFERNGISGEAVRARTLLQAVMPEAAPAAGE